MKQIITIHCPYCDGPHAVPWGAVTLYTREKQYVTSFPCPARKIMVMWHLNGRQVARLMDEGKEPTPMHIPLEVTEPHTHDIMLEQDASALARLLSDDRHIEAVLSGWTAHLKRKARLLHPTTQDDLP